MSRCAALEEANAALVEKNEALGESFSREQLLREQDRATIQEQDVTIQR